MLGKIFERICVDLLFCLYAAVNIRKEVIHGGFDFYLFRIQLFFCVLVALSSFLPIFAVGT